MQKTLNNDLKNKSDFQTFWQKKQKTNGDGLKSN